MSKKSRKQKKALETRKKTLQQEPAKGPQDLYFIKSLEQDQSSEGFFSEQTHQNEMVEIVSSGLLTSDDAKFHDYIHRISERFLSRLGIPTDSLHKFLIVFHNDNSAHLYVNNFQLKIEDFYNPHLGEIKELNEYNVHERIKVSFPEVTIEKEDKVIYCFMEKWKFGMFFFVDPFNQLDNDWMSFQLGKLYSKITYEYIFRTLETRIEFMKMIIDGWFPFVELIGDEFNKLIEFYGEDSEVQKKIALFIDRFDKTRIDAITIKWWNNPIFLKKQQKIEEGIISFILKKKEGYINCITILLKEIEELIRYRYFKGTGKGARVSLNYLLTYLIERGKTKTADQTSLYVPSYFYKYLKEIVFSIFNFEKEAVDFSQHSEDYLKMRALQTVLILDQIYFYLK